MKKSLAKEWKSTVNRPDGVILNFSEIPAVIFNAKNISNCSLTGHMSKKHRINRANIISSRIDNLKATATSFNNSDFKDCHVSSSTFDKCSFNHASHNNNLLNSNYYRQCSFNQTAITLTDFKHCIFEECNFTDVIISDCRFYNCKFIKCITSNKMIESSIVLDCQFDGTKLNYETIVGNFGISLDNCQNCVFELISDKPKQYSQTQFAKQLAKSQNSDNNIENFKLSYFQNASIVSQPSREVECLFDVTDWVKLSQNPNRFKLHIEKLHEFLLYQFDQDRVRLRTLIQLFEMSAKLSDGFSDKSEFIDLQRTVDGIFLSLERIIEKYLEIAEDLLMECDSEGYCRILVEGPLEKAYYIEELKPLLELAPVNFGKIIKHNSPNELYIHWENIKHLWPIILFIFTTRFKVELNKLDQQIRRVRSKKSSVLRDNQLITIESSGLDRRDALSFRLRTLLPGHHELNLVMQFSFDRYKQLLKTLKGWIAFDRKKESAESTE